MIIQFNITEMAKKTCNFTQGINNYMHGNFMSTVFLKKLNDLNKYQEYTNTFPVQK